MKGPFNKHSAASALVLCTLVAPVAGKPLGALVAWTIVRYHGRPLLLVFKAPIFLGELSQLPRFLASISTFHGNTFEISGNYQSSNMKYHPVNQDRCGKSTICRTFFQGFPMVFPILLYVYPRVTSIPISWAKGLRCCPCWRWAGRAAPQHFASVSTGGNWDFTSVLGIFVIIPDRHGDL